MFCLFHSLNCFCRVAFVTTKGTLLKTLGFVSTTGFPSSAATMFSTGATSISFIRKVFSNGIKEILWHLVVQDDIEYFLTLYCRIEYWCPLYSPTMAQLQVVEHLEHLEHLEVLYTSLKRKGFDNK